MVISFHFQVLDFMQSGFLSSLLHDVVRDVHLYFHFNYYDFKRDRIRAIVWSLIFHSDAENLAVCQ